MFRQLVLTSVAGLGLMMPGASTAKAADLRFDLGGISVGRPGGYAPDPLSIRRYEPEPNLYRRGHYSHYHVMYRECSREPYRLYQSYRSHAPAHEVADRLRCQGYQARVVHHD